MKTQTEYQLEIRKDIRPMMSVFSWQPKTGRPFEVRVSQCGLMEDQRKSFSEQLYKHAHRIAESEAEDSATPQEVAARADEIMVELAEMINKPNK